MATLEEAKLVLAKLAFAGMKKLNFAGGEPLLTPKYREFVGELAIYCKQDLGLESISIVSNGSKISRAFLEKYHSWIDILAISVDSFNEETNKKIGRGRGQHLKKLSEIRQWCLDFKIKFKLNTVVNRYNYKENMVENIKELAPFRWKCFQVLILEAENSSSNTIRDATKFAITDEEFKSFVDRHRSIKSIVPEDNETMKNSYLILDEHLCFLNSEMGKVPSRSLLNIDVQQALEEANFDYEQFCKRGGVYDWSEPKKQGCHGVDLNW